MFNQLFGKYLVEQGVVTGDELNEIFEKQNAERVRLGTIAVAEGLMDEKQVEEVNHLQVQMDKRFGDIAVEQGYLTEAQVGELLSKQGNAYMKFLQLLMERPNLPLDRIEQLAEDFKKQYGFSAEELKALKEDNFDEVVPIFVYASKPYVTELMALVMRNMVRFATSDFYIGKVQKVNAFDYKCFVGQRLVGDSNIVLGFVGDTDDEGIALLASDYSGTVPENLGNEMYDAIGEFSNICNGLLATDLSDRSVNVDMEPPFIYLDQTAEGEGYLIPMYVHGKELKVFISVDADVTVGQEPYVYEIKKQETSSAADKGKGTVVIVDDSIFIRKTLRGILEDMGYQVVGEAVNGLEGVEEYKRCNPDILTLDITMPEMDGIAALKEIKAYDKKAKVIMVTAAGQQSKVIEALKLGAEKFIMKPFEKEELKKAIEELI